MRHMPGRQEHAITSPMPITIGPSSSTLTLSGFGQVGLPNGLRYCATVIIGDPNDVIKRGR